jgi:predicted nucleotidyltransferase
MSEIKLLTKVVVGSRLHGLDTPTSDWDYRGIHIYPLKDALSPFKTLKNTQWIEEFIYDAYTHS